MPGAVVEHALAKAFGSSFSRKRIMLNVPPRGTPAEFFVDGREKATHEKATAHGPWVFSTVAVAAPSASAVDMSTTCTVQRARASWSGSGRRDSKWKVHAAQRSSESNSESTRLPTSPEAPKRMTGPAGAAGAASPPVQVRSAVAAELGHCC